MTVEKNIINRLRVFIGGELDEGAANLIESQAAQIAHLQMALADTEALEAGTSERFLKQAAQIEILRHAVSMASRVLDPLHGAVYTVVKNAMWITPTQALERFAAKVRNEALEDAALTAERMVLKQSTHVNSGEPFKAHMHWEDIAAAIRELKWRSGCTATRYSNGSRQRGREAPEQNDAADGTVAPTTARRGRSVR